MSEPAPMKVIPWDGKPITVPGIYSGIPMDAYHSATICDGPSVSSTILRKVEEVSMDEVFDKYWPGNPDRDEPDSSEALTRGRARHTLLLGEEGFRQEFLIRPETYPDGATYPSEVGTPKPWNGNAKWCKAWLAAAQMAGKSVLKPDEIPNIKGAAARLAQHPAIENGLLNGLIEHSIFYKDPKTGLWVKVRPDAIPTDSRMVADYKGAESVQPRKVRKSITEYGYHQQMALISDALFYILGWVLGDDDHVLVFQKWTRPWTINVKPVHLTAIHRGRQQNRRALDKIALALETGVWPGPDDDMVPAYLDDYREKQLANDEEAGTLPKVEEPSLATVNIQGGAPRRRRSLGSRILSDAPSAGEAV